MNNKHFTIVAIIFISILTMNFRCGKDIQPAPFERTFELKVDISPLKKTYSLTDTIWIETVSPNKILFDTKTNQNINADTGKISFRANFNLFGTLTPNPSDGFCDVITPNGVNVNRTLSYWGTAGSIENFGCGQPNYKCKIGFKPNHRGTFYLALDQDMIFESCPNKIAPYNASISFRYKNVDLNWDVFNALSDDDKGGVDGNRFYSQRLNESEIFVFRVQ